MVVDLKNGIGGLLFGMLQKDVKAILGNPDKQFLDEDDNVILLYNALQLRLTFYEDEDFKLGYIISSNPDCVVLNTKIIGRNCATVRDELPFKNWEQEDFDSTENYFNESNWLTLQSEFGIVIRVELGAIINDEDEFVWKF